MLNLEFYIGQPRAEPTGRQEEGDSENEDEEEPPAWAKKLLASNERQEAWQSGKHTVADLLKKVEELQEEIQRLKSDRSYNGPSRQH